MTKFLLSTFLLLRSICLLDAQCQSGNCIDGYGIARLGKQSSVAYTGNFQNKKPEGFGKAQYADGSRYEGYWQNGKWQGKGTFWMASGNILTGVWEDSRYIGADNESVVQTPNDVTPARDMQLNTNISPSKSVYSQSISRENSADKPQVWVMAVGVAAYRNSRITLKYAQSDAMEMQALWRGPEGGSLDYKHLMVLTNDRATRQNILDSMQVLFGKAHTNDLVIFYFSGHGLKGSFLPHDYNDNEVRIDYREIMDILKRCPAKHKIVIGDACYVGSFLASKSPNSRSDDAITNNKFFKDLANTAPGTALMLSSSASEESFEISSYGRSIFTHYILEGLKGEADTNNDYIITVQELFDYASHNVQQLARDVDRVQTPLLKGNFDPNMPVAMRRKQ